MNKVVCYPRSCKPLHFEDGKTYIELFSSSTAKAANIGSVGVTLLNQLKSAGLVPTQEALDFTIIALSVVSADAVIPRSNSPDGWTRQIELSIHLNDKDRWEPVRDRLEVMLRFLSGDFWKLCFLPVTDAFVFSYQPKRYESDCVCLLSGGVDSLVGAIDLVASERKPLLISQIVRGDAEVQRMFAAALGHSNHFQWSCHVNKTNGSENSTRARSLVFFAYALLATCGIGASSFGRKEIFVPENGFISLNIPLNNGRIGSFSTKTTHPTYMVSLQEIWNAVGINVNLVLPYRHKTKGEVLVECKSQDVLTKTINHSISCGKYRRHRLQHCGVCVPCLVRRAAFLRAGIEDKTNRGYAINNLGAADSNDVNAVAMAVRTVELYGSDKFIKSGLSFASAGEREQFLGVISRGIIELGGLLKLHGVL